NGDTDNDGIDNLTDNCPSVSNANQSNADGDAQGDACDTTPNGDTDNDGVDDLADNCVSVSNANQLDTDTDGMGDACDSTVNGDTDNDGIDNLSDNCPSVSNANQSNADGDAQGDACDTTPNGDTDGDGVDNSSDNCIAVSNADQLDTDNDGAGDLCDLFPDDELLLLEQNGVAKNEQLASSVAMADMNNDGVVDVLVGAPLANVLVEGKILKKAGVIRIVSGKDNSILRTLNGAVANQQFGTAIAVVSDQNSDGVPDVVAGEPLADIAIAIKGKTRTIKSAGRVALYSGSNGERLSVIAEGNNTGDRFGAAVAVHDINNDAQPDLIVGAPLADAMVKDGGQVTVFNGISSSVLYRRQGDQAGEQFGAAVAANNQYLFVGSPLRDVLVPGKGNVVIDKDAGQVSVFSLSNNPSLLARLTGAAQNDHFGAAVSASDVHWAVGIPLSDNALPGDLLPEKAGKDTGSVQLFAGMNITPIAILKGSSAGDNYGSALNMQGDVNGDGRHDVAVGAAKFDVSSIAARRKAAGTRTILLKDAGRVEVLSGVALEGM
ncbi:MAG: thrombospondin type 3 repeat-containing protein, partial [Pseudomonadales bacterium]|nr:thrombospondin type 3 repeat-containing protein [Pseudomonadales bacterium]